MEGQVGTTLDSQQVVDRITYLASLASQRAAIDPRLETLREVTATWDKSRPFTSEQQSELKCLEDQLRNYLINEDPLRAFTAESLEERLNGRTAGTLNTATRNLITMLLLTFASGAIGFVLPFDLSLSTRALLIMPFLFVALHLGIIWFYVTAMRNFKADTKRVFAYFCVAAVVFAIGFSQYVIIELLNLAQYPLFKYAGILAFFGLAFLLMFLGLRTYAQLLGLKSRIISLPFSLGLVALSMVILLFVPHTPTESELFFRITALSGTLHILTPIMGSVLASKIRKVVTPAYAKPMTTLRWYLLFTGLSSIGALAILFVVGELHGLVLSIVLGVCGIPVQMILLYAGYQFKKGTAQ